VAREPGCLVCSEVAVAQFKLIGWRIHQKHLATLRGAMLY
jgi:hypothetical protein